MYFDNVQKVFSAMGIQVKIIHEEYGAWRGYHYSWDAFNEGWENSKVTDVSETFNEAVGKLAIKVSGIIADKKGLLKGIKETGYEHNGFVYKQYR